MTQNYRPRGSCRSCSTMLRTSPWSPGPSLVVSRGRTAITFHTPSTPYFYGPRASSVQVSSMGGACACAQPMVNRTDPASRQVDISIMATVLFWRSEPGLGSLYSYGSRNVSGCPPLLSLISPCENAVLRKRPPEILLEHPPKRTNFYMQRRLGKSTKCMQSPFCGFCGGFEQNPRSTKTPAA